MVDEKDETVLLETALLEVREKHFWQSKKWWMAILAASIPIINRIAGIDLDAGEIWIAVGPMIAYILGQSLDDMKH